MYLNLLPDGVYGINGKNIPLIDIPIEPNVAEILSKI
jgi:hypothetical protein